MLLAPLAMKFFVLLFKRLLLGFYICHVFNFEFVRGQSTEAVVK